MATPTYDVGELVEVLGLPPPWHKPYILGPASLDTVVGISSNALGQAVQTEQEGLIFEVVERLLGFHDGGWSRRAIGASFGKLRAQ